ncbi:MAG: protein kinase [Myxococcota bacterium]|nr:serine/threonine-protein kinase [Myxococcota bacterium]
MTTTGEVTTSLVFDRYRPIRRLAVGGMGEIFLARQVVGLDRLVILKSLLPHLAQDTDAVQQFINEARVAATLNHPNIVSIYDVGSWHDVHFIVMEYIAGEHLGQVMSALARDGKAAPPQVVMQIIRDALAALDFAHHAKNADGQLMTVIHRDVSPQNVMIREDGVVKVVDFGIARADSLAVRTRTGMVKGKLPYMAPELLHGQPATTRSDQYSVGVLAWEMLTGGRLFQGVNDAAIASAIVAGNVPMPSSVRPELPPEVDEWVLTMLAAQPEKRYERCSAAARVATTIAASLSDPSDENSVARYIGDLIGGSVAERVRNLTPTDHDLLQQQVTRTTSQVPVPTTKKVPVHGHDKRAVRWATVALIVSVLALVAMSIVNKKKDAPVATSTARLTLESEPAGATVTLGETYLGATPLTLAAFPAGQTQTLRVTLRDHQSLLVEVGMNAGEQRTIHLDLTPLAKVAAGAREIPQTITSPPKPQAKPRETSKSRPTKPAQIPQKPAPTPAPAPAPTATAAEDALVTIRTKPWTKVTIDGRNRGETPLSKIALTPGPHTIVFDNPEEKIHKTHKVVLKSGENQKVDLDFTH